MLRQGKRLADALARAGSIYQQAPRIAAAGSQQDESAKDRAWTVGLPLAVAAMAMLGFAEVSFANSEAENGLEAPTYPFWHFKWYHCYDHGSIRRGHQVYQQVCAACHSMDYIHYRHLVGVAYTEAEAKAIAAEAEIEDGPDEEGNMFTRPGKLYDKFPNPYKNEQAARYVNGGAYPPDLSVMAKARMNGHNYLMALLTGYKDPPAGVQVREGLYYNPYFPGGAIAMPKMLVDEAVEYDDGTPASESQMAKDVVTYLAWSAEPEADERKLTGCKYVFGLLVMLYLTWYFKRFRWTRMKTRRVIVDVIN